MKRCLDCNTEKLEACFSRDRHKPDELRCYCKVCASVRTQDYRRRHPEQGLAYYRANKPRLAAKQRADRKMFPDRFSRKRIKALYGVTPEAVEALRQAQSGECAGCHSPLPAKLDRRKANIDHDHRTGKVRGILCANCNTGLGLLQENPTIMRRLSLYVEVHYGRN